MSTAKYLYTRAIYIYIYIVAHKPDSEFSEFPHHCHSQADVKISWEVFAVDCGQSVFPNVEVPIALLDGQQSNCNGERSLSRLRLIDVDFSPVKTY